MDTKRDLTKELLADCFKKLLCSMPFSKITIRMITDEAGLIRPTFYKHFQDKYEVIEWIFDTEIASGTDLLLEHGMAEDAILMLLKGLEKEKTFYKKAYTIEGPNSFRAHLENYLYSTFLHIANRYPQHLIKENIPSLTEELIARYYTTGFSRLVEDWILGRIDCSAGELKEAYTYLLSHSAFDMLLESSN